MRTLKTLLFCAMMLTAGVAVAHQIRTDWDRGAEFYKYRTFMWAKEPELENPWMNEQIINAVTAELQARGLCLVNSDADLAVRVNTATCQSRNIETFYARLWGGWGWYYYWTPLPSISVVETLPVDTLVVDLFDTQAQRVVWWSTGTEAITEKTERNVKNLNRAVGYMFEDFPPRIRLIETESMRY